MGRVMTLDEAVVQLIRAVGAQGIERAAVIATLAALGHDEAAVAEAFQRAWDAQQIVTRSITFGGQQRWWIAGAAP